MTNLFENILTHTEVLTILSIVLFCAFLLFSLVRKIIYTIVFGLYLLFLNSFISYYDSYFNHRFVYISATLSLFILLAFIMTPINKPLEKEENVKEQEDLSLGGYAITTPFLLLILYMMFIPITYIMSSVPNAIGAIHNVVNAVNTRDNSSASKPSYASRKMAEESWTVMKCAQMSPYEQEQNYYSCLRAAKYVNENKYKYGL